MSQIFWTPVSLTDLQNISIYIEHKQSLVSANRVCRSIYEAVQQLRRFPEAGKIGLEDGTRELVVTRFPAYIIVYRLVPQQGIEVLRIWHAAQQRSE